jgi:hypothetical protein
MYTLNRHGQEIILTCVLKRGGEWRRVVGCGGVYSLVVGVELM